MGTLAARSDRLQTILVKEPCDVENIILIAVIVLYGLLLVAVVAFAALVYVPINPRTGGSLIYFEDIAAMDSELFESRAKGISTEAIENHLLDQIHSVSKIASVKMRRVRWAFLLSAPAKRTVARAVGLGDDGLTSRLLDMHLFGETEVV